MHLLRPTDREALLNKLKDRMVESVRVNFDFTHRISYIASPLTVWRLAACTAVWAGNNELESAHKTTRFQLDEGEGERRREDGRGAEGPGDETTAHAATADEVSAAILAAAVQAEEARRAAEQAKLEAEAYVEGQLDPEEIAARERPPLKEWAKYVYVTNNHPN